METPSQQDGPTTRPTRELEGTRHGSEAQSALQEALLRHPTRAKIREILARWPGLNKNQLRDRLGVQRNVLEFHLGRMSDADLLVTRTAAQAKETLCFRIEDADLWEDEQTRILFGRSSTRELGMYLAENPGASTKDLSEALGLALSTIRHHLRTLGEFELVTKSRRGQQVGYHPEPPLEAWVEDVGSSFPRPWRDRAGSL